MEEPSEFAKVAGGALDETRERFKEAWVTADIHENAVNCALGLFCGILIRRLREKREKAEAESWKINNGCGCTLDFEIEDSAYHVRHCAIHKAAPDLLEAVKRIVYEDEAGEITGGAIEDCKQAVEKAEGQS